MILSANGMATVRTKRAFAAGAPIAAFVNSAYVGL